MFAVRLAIAVSALRLQAAARIPEPKSFYEPEQDNVMLQLSRNSINHTIGRDASRKQLCRSDCATRKQAWSQKCSFHSCKECAECATDSKFCKSECPTRKQPWSQKCGWNKCKECPQCDSSTTTTTTTTNSRFCKEECPTRKQPWSQKCGWNKCKECPQCGSESSQKLSTTTTTTTTAVALRCENWCKTDERSWAVKCALNFPGACSGCADCAPNWPKSATQEFPDARSISYKDWQCQKVCQSRSELVEGAGEGCCEYAANGACKFYPGGVVDSRSNAKGGGAWPCAPDKTGGGKCAGYSRGKTCKGAPSEIAMQFVPAPRSSRNLIQTRQLVLDWSDEFNNCPSGRPDPRVWSFETTQREDRLQWYTEKNAECVDGKLVITAKRETPMEAGFRLSDSRGKGNNVAYAAHFKYTSSSLTSKGKRSFVLGGRGKVEMRAKVDVRSGSFPAWWTMGEPTDFKTPCEWPGCGEIDIMEYVGGTGWMKTNFCHPRGGNAACSWGKEWCTCDWNHVSKAVNKTWADEFHTWAMEWDESKDVIKVTLDGTLFNSQTFSEADPANTGRPENPFRGKRQYMILNFALGFVGGDPTPTTSPMKFEIDYVRAYKEK